MDMVEEIAEELRETVEALWAAEDLLCELADRARTFQVAHENAALPAVREALEYLSEVAGGQEEALEAMQRELAGMATDAQRVRDALRGL